MHQFFFQISLTSAAGNVSNRSQVMVSLLCGRPATCSRLVQLTVAQNIEDNTSSSPPLSSVDLQGSMTFEGTEVSSA